MNRNFLPAGGDGLLLLEPRSLEPKLILDRVVGPCATTSPAFSTLLESSFFDFFLSSFLFFCFFTFSSFLDFFFLFFLFFPFFPPLLLSELSVSDSELLLLLLELSSSFSNSSSVTSTYTKASLCKATNSVCTVTIFKHNSFTFKVDGIPGKCAYAFQIESNSAILSWITPLLFLSILTEPSPSKEMCK